MSIFQAVYDNTPLFWANLVDVSLQDVMSQLQHLLSVQFSFLPAEPECHESMATPGGKKNKTKTLIIPSSLFPASLFFLQQRVVYLGSQRNLSSWPSSLHINHSLKEEWLSILLPSFLRNRKGDSCSRRCINSAQGSDPLARVPAFTTSNNWWRR